MSKENPVTKVRVCKSAEEFKQINTFEERKSQSEQILLRYPDRIPVICDAYHSTSHRNKNPDIDKVKFLVPHSLQINEFIYIIRKRLKMNPEHALFLLTGSNNVLRNHMTVIEAYIEHKDADGFLYLKYTLEATFG